MFTKQQLAARLLQGDVQLTPVDAIPASAVPVAPASKEGVILQMSEVSGHHHWFRGTAAVDLFQTGATKRDTDKITFDEGKYILVKEETDLFHGRGFSHNPNANGTGDHKSMRILPGMYKVDIVNSYNYDTHETQKVVD